MNDFPWAELVGCASCLTLGSLVAGVEAALVSLPDARLRALRDELPERRRKPLARFLEDPSAVLTRLLAFRVSALIVASILAANAVIVTGRALWWHLAVVASVISIAYGALAELATTVGRMRGRSIAATALALVRPVEWLMTPLAAPLVSLGRVVQNRVAVRTSDESPVTQREVEYLVEQAEITGVLDKKRGQMLQNVLELKDLTAKDVLVPRTQMVTIEGSVSVEKAVSIVTEEAHSRVPVFSGQADNIVGVLHVKDLFREARKQASAATMSVETLARKPPLIVAATQSALTVLREMQGRRMHLAMVVDEFGSVVGLVTLEDILEELVGDIQDEHDADETHLTDLGDGKYLVSAAIPLADLGEALRVEFPDDESYASLGGFLAERAGRVPSVGTVVSWSGYKFTVCEGDRRRATKVEVLRERGQPAGGGLQVAAE